MNLNVVWKNRSFKIRISKEKTLLDLKQAIANKIGENTSYTSFNICCGLHIITNASNSKTLKDLNISRLIRLPIDFNPGKQDLL